MANYIVFDTETTNSLDCPFMYDMGWAVITDKGEVLTTKNLVIDEIFNDADFMSSAYYAEKLPKYHDALASGERKIVSLHTARKMFFEDCKRFNVRYMSAHNARFDYRSTTTTQRYLTCSKYRSFLPRSVRLVDTLKMARIALKDNEDYRNFCHSNGYLTSRGCLRYTAEILYRFLSGDNEFIEEHQGLADVLIEKDILLYCLQFMQIDDGVLW